MPKGKVETIQINKDFFRRILRYKKKSIVEVATSREVSCSEKTIRRALNSGRIRPDLLNRISIYLDLDPEFVSGEAYERILSIPSEDLRSILLLQLHPDKYPYYRKERREALATDPTHFLNQLLPLFNISIEQYENLSYDKQYLFLRELFESVFPVLEKHFEVNGYGVPLYGELESLLSSIE